MVTASRSRSPRIVHRFGDVNPLEYGGGVVFATKDGYALERTGGLEDEGETPSHMTVYGVSIPEDVFAWYDWANADSIAETIGSDAATLAKLGRSKLVKDRVRAIEDIAGYHGWYELDQYPITLTLRELKKRWKLKG